MELLTLGIALVPLAVCFALRKRIERLEAAVATHVALPSAETQAREFHSLPELRPAQVKALAGAATGSLPGVMSRMSTTRLEAIQDYVARELSSRD